MDFQITAICGTLALLVRCGHTLHTMGAVRARSVAAVAARAAIGTASMVLLVRIIGHLVGWIYDDRSMPGMQGPGVYFASAESFIRILPLALLPAALMGGATAERARVRGLFISVALLTALVLPATVAIGWQLTDVIDVPLSGLSVAWPAIAAHLVAAAASLALAWAIGSRAGKYNRDGSANFIPAHSLPIMIAGDLLLIVGIPMLATAVAGDPAGRVVNAMLAASAATLAAGAAVTLRDGRVDVMSPWAGALAGLVAGSLSAPHLPWVAIALGGVAGVVLPYCSLKTDLKFRIDETSGLALPHLIGAFAGAIGAGVGAAIEVQPSAGEVAKSTAIATAGAAIVVATTIGITLLAAFVLNRLGWLRVDAQTESEGLDLAQHDINAYPDFQQTMIKSYHLRQ